MHDHQYYYLKSFNTHKFMQKCDFEAVSLGPLEEEFDIQVFNASLTEKQLLLMCGCNSKYSAV